MSISKIAALLVSSAALVAGHGFVSGAIVDGTYYGGFIVNTYNYMPEVPPNIGWTEKATDLGYIDGSGYSSPDIICHKEATPGALSAEVKAGDDVELQWTVWPESHHGPVITYMANCNGDCSKVDKTTLKFFKIAEAGLINDSNVPGKWASDELIANNNSATVTIPGSIAAGNYVLRHEIIALHSAGEVNGAQNYPQCLNLKVTGGGSAAPDGVLGTELYKATDPGIKINIYTALDSYEIPGPALYTGAAPGSATTAAATTAPATTATASTVSASPIQSSSSRHLTRTRTARPSYSPTRTPTPSSAPTSAVTTSTVTVVYTKAPSTVTETATATASSAPHVTNEPDTQNASSPADVTITSTASGQSAQSSTPASGGDDSKPSVSGNATAAAAPPAAPPAAPSSGDYSTYLSSLSAEQLLETIRSTLKWLVSDKKVHARALAY
ncbi:Glycoside hydrolase, family 61 [Penicillium italicum]|uniref:Glycoside hydrolase, family 61 n=1 Tax=Penicillium italicum TaxID=40296 RepID=A0A0A2KY42_PENIT|nr:Glycoside hydrolase, family 61 [Penicillium italicum]